MPIQHRATQTSYYRKNQSLTAKNVLQFISSLIIPLVFGIFTIVITFHQQKTAREQRLEDLNELREDRREEAIRANNANEFQRQLATDRYRDQLLASYIQDMAAVVDKNNGSLTSNQAMSTVTRAKTLAVIRQLDTQRTIKLNMNQSNVGLLDLPTEILLVILKNLTNVDILYSLLNVDNQRLDIIVQGNIFTNTLDFVLKTLTDDNIFLFNDSIIDRFCTNILPRIHQNIKYLILDSLSMERILLAADYPNLTRFKLFNFNNKILSDYFTGKLLTY
ncbi:unnamed protein product [Rotaria sordida]|uniref:F-box domain-containing protein n=1 Tax=Rotaria sordida TaxID=392033 RepID=A0A819JDA4_9BILA|nr:unnamed protein product [Rotaria sordida]